jgi:PTH1 family peptidyl-tRNA hydrolase
LKKMVQMRLLLSGSLFSHYNASMKQFVFGLGNPGKEYLHTRHNIGYRIIEALTSRLTNQTFAQIAREHHKTQTIFARTEEVFLAKSLTYMNETGLAVISLLEYFDKELVKQLKSGQPAGSAERPGLIVAYDDLDIPVGQWKIQFGKGPKVHNGLNSIREHLGTDQFLHVRVGVDGRGGVRQLSGKDYVLTPFFENEEPLVKEAVDAICQALAQRLQ